MFETLIIEPVFNLLFLIYGLLPGHDFGIAVIIFTIIVRLAMFPLVKKQMYQAKALRELQPEIKEIRKKAKGDKQKETMMIMNLYKERQVSAFGPLGTLLIQLPIIIGLFQAIRWISNEPTRLVRSLYSFVGDLGFMESITEQMTSRFSELNDFASLSMERIDELNGSLRELIDSGEIVFNQELLGVADLSRQGIEEGGLYMPLVIIALLAGFFQYFQSKQTMASQSNSTKKVREILSETKPDQQPDQAELNAAMMRNMRFVFPLITIFFAMSFPGALALYWATSSAIAVIQQRYLLNQDIDDLKPASKKGEVKTKVTVKDSGSKERKKVTNQASSKSNKSKSKKKKKR